MKNNCPVEFPDWALCVYQTKAGTWIASDEIPWLVWDVWVTPKETTKKIIYQGSPDDDWRNSLYIRPFI